MTYLELGRLDEIFESVACASARGPALVRYCRRDYFGDHGQSLDTAVRELVLERRGERPHGADSSPDPFTGPGVCRSIR